MLQHIRASMFVVAVIAMGGTAFAQSTPAAMPAASAMPASTAPPKAPYFPLPPKPDFSSMRFMLGTWSCSATSERRGKEAQHLTVTYSMAPDGYFIKYVTKAAKVSYSAVGSTSTDWVTYDSNAKRWIDVSVGSYGSYGYSTSVGWEHGHILWGNDSFLYDGDVTSSTGTLVTKISDRKLITVGAFTTVAGLLNRVASTCTKI